MQGILPSVAYNPAMLGILSPKQAGPSAGGKNPIAATGPLAQERPRVSGWRVLDRVLGGQTISEGLDAERERLTTEAMRPQAMQRREQLRKLVEGMGPEAIVAFETNPEAFGESVGMRQRPVTASAGSAIYTPATGQSFGVPSFDTSGDQTIERDPITGQVRPVYTRTTPSISELIEQRKADTAELSARFANVAQNANVIDLRNNGATVAEGYRPPQIVNTPQGGSTTVFQGATPVTTVQGNAPASASGPQRFDPQTRGALATASTAAGTARRRLAEAREFITLNRDNPTGAGLWGPLGMAGRAMNPAYNRMDSIAASLIPKEREPGSGPMSDRDILLYGRAQIGLDRPGPANEAIANAAIAQAQRDIEYSAFLDEYAQINGNLLGAGEDWQSYVNANPLLEEGPNGLISLIPEGRVQDWRSFFGWGPRQRGGQSQQASPQVIYDPQGRPYVVRNGQWVPQ